MNPTKQVGFNGSLPESQGGRLALCWLDAHIRPDGSNMDQQVESCFIVPRNKGPPSLSLGRGTRKITCSDSIPYLVYPKYFYS